MSTFKISGLALVAILGVTSMAAAATTTTHSRVMHRNVERTAPMAAPLQEGRSVYVAPNYEDQTEVPITELDGSNAPAH